MPSQANIQVLRGFQPLARSLTVYNADNFRRSNSRHVLGQNICYVIGCTALFLSVSVMSSVNCWTCFLPGLEWSERAYNLALMMCLVQQLVIFTTMTTKNRQIVDALQQLQRTVDSRKFCYFVIFADSLADLLFPPFNLFHFYTNRN